MKGHIAQRYGELVKDIWSGTSRTIAPLKLRVGSLLIKKVDSPVSSGISYQEKEPGVLF